MLGGWLLLGEPLTGLKLGGVTSGVVAVLLMYAAGRVAGAAPATTNKAGYRPTGGDGVELQRLEEEEAEASGGEEVYASRREGGVAWVGPCKRDRVGRVGGWTHLGRFCDD